MPLSGNKKICTNIIMAASVVKPYEDVMTIIKDVKKIFDEDNVEKIE